MKQLILLSLFIFSLKAIAQQQNVCTQQFADMDHTSTGNSTIISETKDIVNDIMNVTGLKGNFAIQEAKIPNAAAVIYNGKRYVLYNPFFIQKLNQATGNDWASVSVLAHEIGHHLNGHTLAGSGSEPETELEADEFSGFIMQRLGASLEEAETAMKLAADIKGSATHPSRNTRLYAIERGWNRASDQLSADIENAQAHYQENRSPNTMIASLEVETKKTPVSKIAQTVLAEQYIAADVIFDEDTNEEDYLTTSGNVVCVKNDRLFIIGQLRKTNDVRYPFVIIDKN